MGKFVKIGEAARLIGVSANTLRRWDDSGIVVPKKHSKGETRFYDVNTLLDVSKPNTNLTYGYARVSSYDQKNDLETQAELLAQFCSANG